MFAYAERLLALHSDMVSSLADAADISGTLRLGTAETLVHTLLGALLNELHRQYPDELGMKTVFIHPFAGVLSAYGMGLADQTVMREQAVERLLEDAGLPELRAFADRLAAEAREALLAQGADPGRMDVIPRLHLRYDGPDAALAVPMGSLEALAHAFTAAHLARFGFAMQERPLMMEAVAVEVTAPGEPVVVARVRQAEIPTGPALAVATPSPVRRLRAVIRPSPGPRPSRRSSVRPR